MALKPTKRHIPKLPEEDVLEIRRLYFRELKSYNQLAEQFGVARSTVQKAVQGMGAYYSSIEDDIPDSVKNSRIPAYHKYSIASIQRTYKEMHPHTTRKRGPYNKPVRYDDKEMILRQLDKKINKGR